MFSAVSGLRNHQTWLDVVGNNIANVNTSGFKYGRVNFQDTLSQTISGPTAPGSPVGGTNARQIGLGSSIGAVDTVHTQGSLLSTDRVLDVAIQGNGFFMVSDTATTYYTRDGAFSLDGDGFLVVPSTGHYVLDSAGAQIQLPITAVGPALESISIGRDGSIVGFFDDGTNSVIAQIGLARFANPDGLLKAGDNLFRETPNSGAAQVGAPQTDGRGTISSGFIEMSNVDLAQQFTFLIMAERGFQANSRVITTADEMLLDLVNIKR
jgi:flagellar hook protein FlgE